MTDCIFFLVNVNHVNRPSLAVLTLPVFICEARLESVDFLMTL